MSADSPSDAGTERRAQPEVVPGSRPDGVVDRQGHREKPGVRYRDAVGFTVSQQHTRDGRGLAISLKAGSVELLIGRDDGAKGWDRVKGEGLSLQISTTQNIDELAARIKANGGTLTTEPTDMPWGVRAFRVAGSGWIQVGVFVGQAISRRVTTATTKKKSSRVVIPEDDGESRRKFRVAPWPFSVTIRALLFLQRQTALRYAFTVAGAVNVSTMLPPASMHP